MQSDNRTISEIVSDPNLGDAEQVTDDDTELEQAQVAPLPFTPIPNIVAEALRSAPTVSEAKATAHIPPHFSVAELVGKPIVVAWKEKQKAFLPSDGTMRDGYFVTGAFTDTEETFTTWIGQAALRKILDGVQLPFKTIIAKKGRVYLFS